MGIDGLDVVVFSYSADGFAVIHDTCVAAGHRPLAYVYARALRPGQPSASHAPETVARIVESLPAGVDLILPGTARGLARSLAGHRCDVLVCNGFPWRLPPEVLAVPRLGAINIHPSLLPRHRGPIPLHWGIRSGDAETGVTIHWMTEEFDSGHILAQRGGVTLADDVVPDDLFRELDAVTCALLPDVLERVRRGEAGVPQDHARATYAGWMEEAFSRIDWTRDAREIHNQVRAFRFGVPGPPGPLAQLGDGWRAVLRTSLEPPVPEGGIGVECGDGHTLWIVESVRHDPGDLRAEGPRPRVVVVGDEA